MSLRVLRKGWVIALVCVLLAAHAGHANVAAIWPMAQRIGAAVLATLSVKSIESIYGFAEDGVVYWRVENHVEKYAEFITTELGDGSEGLLLEVEVYNVDLFDGAPLVMSPAPLGKGKTAEDVATNFLIGAPVLGPDMGSMASAYIERAPKIESALGSKASVSSKTFRIWVVKDQNGDIVFHREPEQSDFLQRSVRRAKVLKLRNANIQNLQVVEAMAQRSIQYQELIDQYRQDAIDKQIYAEILDLQSSRAKAESEMRSALASLQQAKTAQRKLKAINAFQQALSIASFAVDMQANMTTQQKIDSLSTGLRELESSTQGRLDRIEAQIQSFQDSALNIANELVRFENEIRDLLSKDLGADSSVVPNEATPDTYILD